MNANPPSPEFRILTEVARLKFLGGMYYDEQAGAARRQRVFSRSYALPNGSNTSASGSRVISGRIRSRP
jgi:hypothetical protein